MDKDGTVEADNFTIFWYEANEKMPIRWTLCTILKFVAASAAEAKLGALFLNAK